MALAEKYQLALIDARGHGRSKLTKTKLTYTLAEDVIAVIAVMDRLRVPHTAIVGWSDGGEIGLALAIRHAGCS